jgi:hypothetical protein
MGFTPGAGQAGGSSPAGDILALISDGRQRPQVLAMQLRLRDRSSFATVLSATGSVGGAVCTRR